MVSSNDLIVLAGVDKGGMTPLLFGESAKRFNYRVVPVEFREGLTGGEWLREIRDVLRGLAGKAENVLWVDSRRAYFLGGPMSVKYWFERVGHPWVFAAGCVCETDSEMGIFYPRSNCRYRFLNAGMFVGSLDYVYGMFREYGLGEDLGAMSVRRIFSLLYLSRPTALKLDQAQSLCFCPKGDKDYEIGQVSGVVKVLSTGSNPCMVLGEGELKGALK